MAAAMTRISPVVQQPAHLSTSSWVRIPGLTHGELEEHLTVKGREVLRTLLQDHLDLRAQREPHLESVVGADGVARNSVEEGHDRGLRSVFGMVTVSRLAYPAEWGTPTCIRRTRR